MTIVCVSPKVYLHKHTPIVSIELESEYCQR